MKFKVGDKVKVVKTNILDKEKYIGKTFTVLKLTKNIEGKPAYELDNTGCWLFFENELVEDISININFNPNDRAGAHKAVEEAIAEYKKKKAEWTEDELAQAREIFKNLIAEWCLDNHKGYCFLVNADKTKCSLFNTNVMVTTPRKGISYEKVAEAEISGNDVFDETIGKVVLLCKALKKPIPDFIKNKNC